MGVQRISLRALCMLHKCCTTQYICSILEIPTKIGYLLTPFPKVSVNNGIGSPCHYLYGISESNTERISLCKPLITRVPVYHSLCVAGMGKGNQEVSV